MPSLGFEIRAHNLSGMEWNVDEPTVRRVNESYWVGERIARPDGLAEEHLVYHRLYLQKVLIVLLSDIYNHRYGPTLVCSLNKRDHSSLG